ncbi:MAG: serine hydrolase domain-containing protein [Pseudomonadota bacterium]
MPDFDINGFTASGFEPVRNAFEANFVSGDELGAGFCVFRGDDTLVDLTGGFSDRARTAPWAHNTIVPVFSTTKPIAALVMASVIDMLTAQYETPVAEIWPEFGTHGKAAVTIGELLSHQAGLPGFVDEIDPALWLEPARCAAALAAQAPLWEPGTAHGYHPMSWGYFIGELVQRLSSRSLGTILREDICEPNDIDFQIGIPASEDDRVAKLQRPKAMPDLGELNEATKVAFLTKWAAPNRNAEQWRRIEIPSANGHGTARSVATLFGIYTSRGMLGGQRVISPTAFAGLTQLRTRGSDLVLPFETGFGAGIMHNVAGLFGPNPNTLCHAGWGGSMGLADPDAGISAAYVMNQQSNHLMGDPRARCLIDAVYACL